MEITVKDRQTLLDIAIVALGSAAGVFTLVRRNGISLTSRLTDGQTLEYEASDIVSTSVRDTYEARGLSPASDLDSAEYLQLLADTGSAVTLPTKITVEQEKETADESLLIDPLEQAIADAVAGIPPKWTETDDETTDDETTDDETTDDGTTDDGTFDETIDDIIVIPPIKNL